METMDRWKININDARLQKIYEEFLYRANELLTFYLSCLVLDKYTEFKEIDLDKKIPASNNFHESATSIRNISEIKKLISSDSFSQIYHKQTFIALITAFYDLLEEILYNSNIKEDQIKKNITIKECTQEYCLNTAGAKIIYHLCKHYDIDPVINRWQGITYINNLFNIRNLFIHSRGIFDEKYRKYLVKLRNPRPLAVVMYRRLCHNARRGRYRWQSGKKPRTWCTNAVITWYGPHGTGIGYYREK